MLLEDLSRDVNNYPHVISALEHPHLLICSTEEYFVLFCTVSKVFIAECSDADKIEEVAEILKKQNPIRFQTTCKKLFQNILPNFAFSYTCVQEVFPEKKENSAPKLELLRESDLSFAAEANGLNDYIFSLHERNRIFGLYINNQLVGFALHHIDETTGGLYVKPEFRNKGYGALIMQEAFSLYKDGIAYSQILTDNQISIKLHQKIGCIQSKPLIYWAYNMEYTYK